FVTSGIRLGTPAVTTRGLLPADMVRLADWIDAVVSAPDDASLLRDIGAQVQDRMSGLPIHA
ncbi:MAG: hypothetical protein RJA19_1900, partial [Bacteroidota bacterium]